ncbi:ABC transporter permease [Flavobacteriales bacterium]|nr:ABC transporter permease [Flavobacteriales bacterium]
MNKIWLIISREYLVRVKKKSFIVMTILGPILMAALLVTPTILSMQDQQNRLVALSEKNIEFLEPLNKIENTKFTIITDEELELLKKDFSQTEYYAVLDKDKDQFYLLSDQQISLSVKRSIADKIEKIIERNKLKLAGIDLKVLESSVTEINIQTKIITLDGENINSSTEGSMGIGFITGILIYMFIFMYGTMVMRGVIEEKTNRIVEVIISSVKPFQLMMGKIIGVALVGLTQFILWIILTMALAALAELLLFNPNELISQANSAENTEIMSKITNLIGGINFMQIILCFIFYFISGYLLYSSLFAAVGSAVDAEADTQQFVVPITVPLLLAIMLIQPVMDNPDGTLAFWMSMIPFTSPVIMMVRLPFGVENWELFISMLSIITGFVATTFLAAKIYRTGILMYGKKISYKELWKWLSYKG